MGNKIQAIQVDLGMFMHISAYLDMFRNYSGIFRTLSNTYKVAFCKCCYSYCCFRKLNLFSWYQLFIFSTLLNKSIYYFSTLLTPEV